MASKTTFRGIDGDSVLFFFSAIWRKSLSDLWRALRSCKNSWRCPTKIDRLLWIGPIAATALGAEKIAPLGGRGGSLALRTAQRWVALYRTSGLAPLARETRLDHGARRVVSEPMKRAIEGLAFENPQIPITPVHRQIKEYAEAIVDTVPSYWAAYDIVREGPRVHAPLLIREQGIRRELQSGPLKGI